MELIRILSFILVIFCRWHQQEAAAHECTATDSVCAQEFDNLRTYRSQHRYVSDNDTLTEMCKLQSVALKCVNSFAEECLREEEQQVFKTLTKGSDVFFNDFCLEEGALRKKYLQHAECIKSVSTELDACGERYEASQNVLNENEGDSSTLKLRTCCIYIENIHCSSNATFGACGQKAAELVAELWKILGGSYLNEVCYPFSDYDMKDCQLTSRTTKLPVHTNSLNTMFSLLCYATFHLWLHKL